MSWSAFGTKRAVALVTALFEHTKIEEVVSMKRALIFVIAAIAALPHVGCGGGGSVPLTQAAATAPAPSPTPAITSISPSTTAAGGAAFTLTVTGTNFVVASIVNFAGAPRTTTFVSATQLTAAIPAVAVMPAGVAAVSVTNPSPGGGTSNAMTFTITGQNPIPSINGLIQNCAHVGGQAFTLFVYGGQNFLSNSVVRWNGVDRSTTFFSSDELSVQISASDIASPGKVALSVFNPPPGGGTSNVWMFTIAAGGTYPQSVAVDPTGKFAYVANAGCAPAFTGSVSIYTINAATGALQPIGTVKAGTSSQSVAVHPSGNFAYVANGSGNISLYTVDPTTGLLTPKGTVDARGRAVAVAVHPSGRFAYVTRGCYLATNNLGEGVSIYSVDTSTGALTFIGTVGTGAPGPSACSIYVGITIDASGKFAYVAEDGCGLDIYPGYISAYSIDPGTGELTPVGQAIGAGYCSRSVSVDSLSKFAYVPNSQEDDVSIYAIGSANGALTFLQTAPTGTAPASSAVHPSGKFAYVVNRDSNDVSMYTIDSNTGILTGIGTIAAGSSPSSIAIDPSGKFAYVTNAGSNDVSMYSIDADSGALTPIGSIGT